MKSRQIFLLRFIHIVLLTCVCASSPASSSGVTYTLPSFTDFSRGFANLSHLRVDNEAVSVTRGAKNSSLPLFRTFVAGVQANCSLPVWFIRAHPHGWGALLNYGMLAAVMAWSKGFRVSFVPPEAEDDAKQYFDDGICRDKEHKLNVLACYFRSLDVCRRGDLAAWRRLEGETKKSPLVLPFANLRKMREISEAQQRWQELVPTPWYWSAVYSLLYRPSVTFADSIAAQQQKYARVITDVLLNGNSSSVQASNFNLSSVAFVCVHMRGEEKKAEASVLAPAEYAVAALKALRSPRASLSQQERQAGYILLVSEDDARMRAFAEHVRKLGGASTPVVSLNPISRHDERKYLHVTQMTAVLQLCARARAVVATVSSNVGRLLLYEHLLTRRAQAYYTSLDLFLVHQHATVGEMPPIVDVRRPPYFPT